jgi:hypothetical protein
MPQTSVHELLAEMEALVEALRESLTQDLDFAGLEQVITARMNELGAELVKQVVEPLLVDAGYVERLKHLGGQQGLKFKEYRPVRVRLGTGQWITVKTAYFTKAPPKSKKRRAKRQRRGGRGAYLGLEALGFLGHYSLSLVSEVVELAVLCPSLAVAQTVLARRGLVLDVKTIRRLCGALGQRGLALRGAVSVAGSEALAGRTLVIGIDGGRLRERRRKRGRKKAGLKRQGYHSDWREPKLFTIYVTNAEGEIVREVPPFHDATLGDHEVMFAVLEQYLRALDLAAVQRVVFCGDGAPWIWADVEALIERLGLEAACTHQVLDYTHAKQNLHQILAWLPKRLRTPKVERRWKALLWRGDIAGLGQAIAQTFVSKRGRKKALAKWQSYFAANTPRMQYERFEQQGLPCGSGSVESAIRRVINLRLKAPGTFWTEAMAECFLFLRAQLVSGRWAIMLANITAATAKQVCSASISEPSSTDNHWLEAA